MFCFDCGCRQLMEVGCVGGGNGKVLMVKKNVSPDRPPCCAAAMLFVSLVRRGAGAMLFLSPVEMLCVSPARRGNDDASDARALRRQMVSPREA